MKEIYAINTKKQTICWPKFKNSEVENCFSESEGQLEILFYCFSLCFYIIKD